MNRNEIVSITSNEEYEKLFLLMSSKGYSCSARSDDINSSYFAPIDWDKDVSVCISTKQSEKHGSNISSITVLYDYEVPKNYLKLTLEELFQKYDT